MTTCIKNILHFKSQNIFYSVLRSGRFFQSQNVSHFSNIGGNPIIAIQNYCLNQQCSVFTTNSLFKKARVKISLTKHDGQQLTASAKEGETILDVVVNNELDLKGYGACEGTLSCSTCHIILKPEDYEKLKEKPSDEELDMLDLALEVSPTSRLGCQVTVTKDMEGLQVQVPAVARDARENPVGTDSAST